MHPRRQCIRGNMKRSRQHEGVGQKLQRMAQVDDVDLLARIELPLQFLGFQAGRHQLAKHHAPPIQPPDEESQDRQQQQASPEPAHPVEQAGIALERVPE